MPPAAPQPPVFEARGLGKSYAVGDVQVQALVGVDLQVQPAEMLVLLGPSGSGKSTLLNLLGGLDVPDVGELRFRGVPLPRDDEAALTRYRREQIGFVFQSYNLLPSLTVWENVALAAELVPQGLAVDEVLQRVGLKDRAQHFPSQLSGGEQQRVAIARAIVKQPAVLLCDEPTGALDYATGKRVLEVLVDVNRQLRTTVIIITHNASMAGLADRVLRLADGRIVEEQRHAQRLSPSEISW